MYDFVIIGGGIIGMSTAMQLIDVYPDARIALLEKESGPACHQTGHNSGVIHAGVYYTPGSLKAQFCLAGNRATKAFCDQNVLPGGKPRHQSLLRSKRHSLRQLRQDAGRHV